jgi:hypothetical protein
LSAIWFGALRWFVAASTLTRLYTTAPTKYIAPAALIAVVLVVAVVSWNPRRFMAYGALAVLVPAAAMSFAVLLGGSAAR